MLTTEDCLKRMVLLGYVSDRDLVVLLKNALALVYPSPYEEFGLPPLEAMNVGCPVITTYRTSIPEICGESVLYIDPANGHDFGGALVAMENDPELREGLRDAGQRQAAKFSCKKSTLTFPDTITRCNAARERQ